MKIEEILNNSLKLINTKDFVKALNLLNQISANDHRVFNLKGSIYICLDKLDLAEENLINSINLNTNNPAAYHNLANLFFKRNNLQLAKKNYLNALKFNNNIQSLCELASIFVKEKNFIDAEKYYKEALKINREDKRAKLGIGEVYLKTNRIQIGINYINSVNGVIKFSDEGFKITL